MVVPGAVLLASLLLAAAGCSSDPDLPPFPPAAAWPKFRQNVSNTGTSIAPIGQTTPALRWRLPVDAATPRPVSSSPAIATSGRIYVASAGGTLLATDGRGTVHWRVATCALCPEPPGAFVASPLVFDYRGVTTVYLASADGRLFGFEDRGSEVACTLCFSPAGSDPAIGAATVSASPTLTVHPVTGRLSALLLAATVEQAGQRSGRVYAVNADGTLRWQFPDPARTGLRLAPLTASPALGLGANLYVLDDDGTLAALSLEGNLLWTAPVRRDRPAVATGPDAPVGLFPSPVTTSTLVLAAAPDGSLRAFTLDGTFVWEAAPEGPLTSSLAVGSQALPEPTPTPTGLPTFTPTPTGAPTGTPSPTPTPEAQVSTVFGVTSDGRLVVRELRTGTRLPPSGPPPEPLLGPVHSSPAISPDQYLIFGTDAGWIYVLDTGTGTPLAGWPLRIPGGSAIRSSPAIGEDGTIYVGADDGYLYAVGTR